MKEDGEIIEQGKNNGNIIRVLTHCWKGKPSRVDSGKTEQEKKNKQKQDPLIIISTFSLSGPPN